jgi:hypothetical protein
LLGYARMKNLHAGARELRSIMADLFSNDLKETRELLQRFARLRSNGDAPASGPGFDGDQFFSIARSAHAKTIHDPTEIFPTSGVFDMGTRQKSRGPLLAAIIFGSAAITIAVAVLVFAMFLKPTQDPEPIVLNTIPSPPPPQPPPVVVVAPPPPVVNNANGNNATEPVPVKERERRRKKETPPPPPPPKIDPEKLDVGPRVTWLKKNCKLKCATELPPDAVKKAFDESPEALKKLQASTALCAKQCKK